MGNPTQASVSGGGNLFNKPAPTGGNYWSNYDTPVEGCTDGNSDGLCDAPYTFTGGQDNLPWTAPSGWVTLRYILATSISPPGGGSVGLSPQPDADGKYAPGTQVTLTATPNTDYQFQSWSGDAIGTTSPIIITIDGNKTITADFAKMLKVVSLPVGLKVWKLGQPDIDLSLAGQTGETQAVIGPVVGSKKIPVVGLFLNFSLVTVDINFAGQMVAEADVVNAKAVFHRPSYPAGVAPVMDLYVKMLPQHNRVRVCPGATSLAEVTSACPGGYALTLADNNLTVITTGRARSSGRFQG